MASTTAASTLPSALPSSSSSSVTTPGTTTQLTTTTVDVTMEPEATTTNPPTSTMPSYVDESSPSSIKGLTPGATAGIVVAVLVLVAVIVIAIFIFVNRRKKRRPKLPKSNLPSASQLVNYSFDNQAVESNSSEYVNTGHENPADVGVDADSAGLYEGGGENYTYVDSGETPKVLSDSGRSRNQRQNSIPATTAPPVPIMQQESHEYYNTDSARRAGAVSYGDGYVKAVKLASDVSQEKPPLYENMNPSPHVPKESRYVNVNGNDEVVVDSEGDIYENTEGPHG